eukprot:Lankesteria_metandrocarpae@DN1941_c0_g1_i1.p1
MAPTDNEADIRERHNVPLQQITEESSMSKSNAKSTNATTNVKQANLPDWEHLYTPEILEQSKNTTMPLIGAILSLLLPPIGCVVFCMSIKYPAYSERRRMAIVALYIGSALSFVYVLVACIIIGAYSVPDDTNVKLGYGY